MPQPRKLSKEDAEYFRSGAQMLAPMTKVSPHAHIQLSEGGAFVECLVFVPSDLRVVAAEVLTQAVINAAAQETLSKPLPKARKRANLKKKRLTVKKR